MKKYLLFALLSLSANIFAGTSYVISVTQLPSTGAYQGHFIKNQLSASTQADPGYCFPNIEMNSGYSNATLQRGIDDGSLQLGKNTWDVYQCTDASCQQKTLLTRYRFLLIENNGVLTATPSSFSYQMQSSGNDCAPSEAMRALNPKFGN